MIKTLRNMLATATLSLASCTSILLMHPTTPAIERIARGVYSSSEGQSREYVLTLDGKQTTVTSYDTSGEIELDNGYSTPELYSDYGKDGTLDNYFTGKRGGRQTFQIIIWNPVPLSQERQNAYETLLGKIQKKNALKESSNYC